MLSGRQEHKEWGRGKERGKQGKREEGGERQGGKKELGREQGSRRKKQGKEEGIEIGRKYVMVAGQIYQKKGTDEEEQKGEEWKVRRRED